MASSWKTTPDFGSSRLTSGRVTENPNFRLGTYLVAAEIYRIVHMDGYITIWEPGPDEPVRASIHGSTRPTSEHMLKLTPLELAVKELVMHDNAMPLAQLLLPMSAKQQAKLIERLGL